MKRCFKCGEYKDINEFYVHSRMGDGHLNKCKVCTKKDADIRERKLRQDPAWCEKEKQRSKEKYYRLNYRERQFRMNLNKPYKNKIYKTLHKKYNLQPIQNAHHWNYNILNDVIILTKEDHRTIHRFMKLDSEKLIFVTNDNIILDTKAKHASFIKRVLKNDRCIIQQAC